MSCLSIQLTPKAQALLAVSPAEQAKLTLRGYPSGSPHLTAALVVKPASQVKMAISPKVSAALSVTPKPQVGLVIGEVCSVSQEELYVLASTPEGPLRTRSGGYLLLDPAYENDSD